MLIGMKKDLRDADKKNPNFVSRQEGKEAAEKAKFNCGYIECACFGNTKATPAFVIFQALERLDAIENGVPLRRRTTA